MARAFFSFLIAALFCAAVGCAADDASDPRPPAGGTERTPADRSDSAVRTPSDPASEPTVLDQLSWLAGCWEQRDGLDVTEEQWMRPRGGRMLGMSRSLRGGQVVATERLEIREEGDVLVYRAEPSGQDPVEFRSLPITGPTIVFSNPDHDFPQRILYRAVGDSLVARVEGEVDGAVRGVDFPMRRVDCEAGSR